MVPLLNLQKKHSLTHTGHSGWSREWSDGARQSLVSPGSSVGPRHTCFWGTQPPRGAAWGCALLLPQADLPSPTIPTHPPPNRTGRESSETDLWTRLHTSPWGCRQRANRWHSPALRRLRGVTTSALGAGPSFTFPQWKRSSCSIKEIS